MMYRVFIIALVFSSFSTSTLLADETALPIPTELPNPLSVDVASFNYLGRSVALSGDTAIVGAPGADGDSLSNSGAAYVYVLANGVWSQQAKLVASDAASDDSFGSAVAISGDTVIIGAYGKASGTGAAYMFDRDSNGDWTPSDKLTASVGATGDNFGVSVAISVDRAVIGSFGDDEIANDAGAAYVFDRVNGSWSQSIKLTATNAASDDLFGNSVAVAGDTVVVGAYGYTPTGACNAGTAYVFTRTVNNSVVSWPEISLVPSGTRITGQHFGYSVAISSDGTRALVGAPGDANLPGFFSVFDLASNWSVQEQLSAGDLENNDQFGSSISLSGNLAIIGADQQRSFSGAAYVFADSGSNVWSQQRKITASDGEKGDHFGASVSIDGNSVLVGAYGKNGTGEDALGDPAEISTLGSAYVYNGDIDSDSDSFFDLLDNCPLDDNDQLDTDGDGLGDVCDALDSDGDGIPDSLDPDDDNDGTLDANDDFPLDPTEQIDTDSNGIGNNTDDDDDGDGTLDEEDAYPLDNSEQVDSDNDGIGNNADIDDDNDGIPDLSDPYPLDPFNNLDTDADGILDANDADIDGDGIPNDIETQLLLDPFDALDGAQDMDADNYSNSDEYRAGTPLNDPSNHPGLYGNNPFKFFTADAVAGDAAGIRVSIDGGTALVGAFMDDDNGDDSGAAYIFTRNVSGEWLQSSKLIASDGAAGDNFGSSVSLSGDIAIVGAYRDDVDGGSTDGGSAYAFIKDAQGNWTQEHKFEANAFDPVSYNGHFGDHFGYSVAISENTVVIGAPDDRDNPQSTNDLGSGTAFVLERTAPATWTPIGKLIPSDGTAQRYFGTAVAIDADLILVGAPGAGPNNTDQGAVYVYQHSQTTIDCLTSVICISEETKLEAAPPAAADAAARNNFGASVSTFGNTTLVGASYTNLNPQNGSQSEGAAYVFLRDAQDVWTLATTLTAGDAMSYDYFGTSVYMSGNAAVIGASGDDDNGSGSGSVYLYAHDALGDWRSLGKFTPEDGSSADYFGSNVSLSDDKFLVGAWSDDDLGTGSGSAYQYAVVLPPDTDSDGLFDDTDNCPGISNLSQLDTDSDDFGNACDNDDDNDGLSDAIEQGLGTNPLLQDTDGDTFNDAVEVAAGSDPLSAASVPAIAAFALGWPALLLLLLGFIASAFMMMRNYRVRA